MTINELLSINVTRTKRWHKGNLKEWSTLEWAAAMAGEAGETCNAAKKLKRLEDEIPSHNEVGRHYESVERAKAAIAAEISDTIIYAVLVAARIGIVDLEEEIRKVFNKKSKEYGFPEKL